MSSPKISKQARDRALNFLDDKLVRKNCPFCDTDEWALAETVFTLKDEQQIIGCFGDFKTEFLPVVPLICKNCGYTVLFNAFVVGLVKKVSAVN